MAKANKSVTEGRYVHTIPGESKPPAKAEAARPSAGYRPHRQTARRRARPK
jgi:hypothetical protein